MQISSKDYLRLVDAKAKPSPMGKDLLWAFCTGGLICVLGQGLHQLYMDGCGLSKDDAGTWVSITLIFLSALFTGLGLFEKLAKHAGAGTLVPITGFANAMASPALEFKSEGLVTGTGTKLFSVAGPVIVYGVTASIVLGAAYYLLGLLG